MAGTCRPKCSTLKNTAAFFSCIYLSYSMGRIAGVWHDPVDSTSSGAAAPALRTAVATGAVPKVVTAPPVQQSIKKPPSSGLAVKGATTLESGATVPVHSKPDSKPADTLEPAAALKEGTKAGLAGKAPNAEPPSNAAPPAVATPAAAPVEAGDLDIAQAPPASGTWQWTEAETRAWLLARGVAKANLVRPEANVPPTPPQPPLEVELPVPVQKLPEEERRSPPLRNLQAELAYLNQSMPAGRPEPWQGDYQERCGAYHKRHAIVTMATGDNAARMAIGLVQSLRDVGTCGDIDIVVMVFGGGVGSTDCREGRTKHLWKSFCSATDIPRLEIVFGQIFLKALLRLNVKFHLAPPLPHHANGLKSINIPGGSQIWWGMALNK